MLKVARSTLGIALAAGLAGVSLSSQAQGQSYTYRLNRAAFVIEPSNVLAISSPDNHCPVEPHPKAINPTVVECHAAFAPVPVIPPLLEQTTPEQREAAGKWLTSQLDQPGVCGKDEKIAPNMSCASLIYVLRKEDRITGIPVSGAAPWVYVVNIFRISHLKDGSDMTLFTINSNASEGRFGPGKDPLWHLLTEQRLAKRCLEAKREIMGTGGPATKKTLDTCRSMTADDWRYEPMLLLPHSKARIVLNKSLVDRVFDAPTYVVRDIEDTMAQFTGANAKLK